MQRLQLIGASSATGVVLATLIAAPVLACTPQGTIVKYVEDQTTSSQKVDANTEATALEVHPGDTLVYTIVVGNKAASKDNSGIDDMIETVLTDTLPDGVTPASGTKTITETLGNVKEKTTVTKSYTVKVDANATDGQVITNKACFTGEATNHDKKQHQAGCDVAIVKVKVPKQPTPPVTPTPPQTPQPQPQIQAASTELPVTGPGNFLVPAGFIGGLGYAANLLRLKRRASKRER